MKISYEKKTNFIHIFILIITYTRVIIIFFFCGSSYIRDFGKSRLSSVQYRVRKLEARHERTLHGARAMTKMSTASINFWHTFSKILSRTFFHDSRYSYFHLRAAKSVKRTMSRISETGDHLGEIYEWIDRIKFSRPKRNIARDFSDGGNKEKERSRLAA